ncbi:hypothetical protein Rcae01_01417 [Novipirellula caenicola]|uniref:Uncharacterized protein n=1 Tax=Novipirellula caenicola TaxID=1536901 RepID=A0ABP9VLC9_9BACT
MIDTWQHLPKAHARGNAMLIDRRKSALDVADVVAVASR